MADQAHELALASLRQELVAYGQRILDERLATGAGGNISARAGDVMWGSAGAQVGRRSLGLNTGG